MVDVFVGTEPSIETQADSLPISTTLSFSQEVACSADLQLHAPYWPEANKPHGNRLSHANREDGMCEDILVDKVVLVHLGRSLLPVGCYA